MNHDDPKIPDNKTFGDCIHCARCCAVNGHVPTDNVCDWQGKFEERNNE